MCRQIPVKGSTGSQPHTISQPIIIDSSIQSDDVAITPSNSNNSLHIPEISPVHNPATSLIRLYLMSYFPSGFWPRLITRLLADDTFRDIAHSMYDDFEQFAVEEAEWKCWQSGIELKYLSATLLRLKEAPWENPHTLCNYRQCTLVIKTDKDTKWKPLSVTSTSILEILIPNEALQVESRSENVQPNAQVVASLLTKIIDHIDTLLEDWYPDLGARFVQNSKGMYLITRIVPCTRCILQQISTQVERLDKADAWSMVDVNPRDCAVEITQPIVIEQTGCCAPVIAMSAENERPREPAKQQLAESAPGLVGSLYNGGRTVIDTLYTKTTEATDMIWPR